MKINERQTLEVTLRHLQSKYSEAMRGRLVPSSRASRIKAQINTIQAEIDRLDQDAAERLALAKAPVNEVLQVIAIPLLADVLNDLVTDVNTMLRRHGVQETIFGMYTSQIRKAALAMVDTLSHTQEGLPRLLDVDDTLVDAVKKKVMSFIRQRINITDSNDTQRS